MDNGDNTPEGTVRERLAKGVSRFREKGQGVDIFLYGSYEGVRKAFKEDIHGMGIVPSTAFYSQDQKPNRPVEGTSLNNLVRDIKAGTLDGFFSIGDTSKVGTESLTIRDRQLKQGLVAIFPTRDGKGQFICSDVGFTNQSSKKDTYQNAVKDFATTAYVQGLMALHYAWVHGVEKPRFGILCNGTEKHKGSDVDKYLDGLINRGLDEKLLWRNASYIGRIEPPDCWKGKADVVFTEGYKGNLFLKSSEGMLTGLGWAAKDTISSLPWGYKPLVWLAAPLIYVLKKRILEKFDPNRYNGALILGLDGAVVKGHGNSSSEAIYHGISRLNECAGKDFVSGLEETVAKYMPEDKVPESKI